MAGCNPWMNDGDVHSVDCVSVTVYKTLDECKVVVPIVTTGYAQCLRCLRELYYVTFKKTAQIFPVVIEDGWEKEEVGKWLENTLKKGEVHHIDNMTDEQKMANIASKIATVLGSSYASSPSFADPGRVPCATPMHSIFFCHFCSFSASSVRLYFTTKTSETRR